MDVCGIENGEVWFRWKGIDMTADLDPGVVDPVVIRGTAVECEVDIEVKFSDYESLQQSINEWCRIQKGKK